MSKSDFLKVIYMVDDGSLYDSLQDLTDGGYEDGQEVAVYRLEKVGTLKADVRLEFKK